MNNDLAGDSAVWRALLGVHGGRFAASAALFVYLSSFVKDPPKMFCGGGRVRLWRRARFSMLYCRWIIARFWLVCLW